jgi:hypothetical protein
MPTPITLSSVPAGGQAGSARSVAQQRDRCPLLEQALLGCLVHPVMEGEERCRPSVCSPGNAGPPVGLQPHQPFGVLPLYSGCQDPFSASD